MATHSFGCKQGSWQLCLGCGAHVCACHGIGHGNCPECYVGSRTHPQTPQLVRRKP